MEKYRPQKLGEVVGNEDAVQRLRSIAQDGNMPHMILTGSPGIGKTTCVMALARQMLGDNVKEAVLELNASDERGIDVVRKKRIWQAVRKVMKLKKTSSSGHTLNTAYKRYALIGAFDATMMQPAVERDGDKAAVQGPSSTLAAARLRSRSRMCTPSLPTR